jgi:hypothetical protein
MVYLFIVIGAVTGMFLNSVTNVKDIDKTTPDVASMKAIIKTYLIKDFRNLMISLLFIPAQMLACYGYLNLDPTKDSIPWISLDYQDEVKVFAGFVGFVVNFSAQQIMNYKGKTRDYINNKLNVRCSEDSVDPNNTGAPL